MRSAAVAAADGALTGVVTGVPGSLVILITLGVLTYVQIRRMRRDVVGSADVWTRSLVVLVTLSILIMGYRILSLT